MIDEKVPREQRDSISLITEGSEVLWIVGGRMNERYKITSETKNVLEIKYQGGKYHEVKNQSITQRRRSGGKNQTDCRKISKDYAGKELH